MTNSISTYLKYANLQMAAEALFGMTPADAPGKSFSGEIAPNFLTAGNNHSSKFTDIQAALAARSHHPAPVAVSGLSLCSGLCHDLVLLRFVTA